METRRRRAGNGIGMSLCRRGPHLFCLRAGTGLGASVSCELDFDKAFTRSGILSLRFYSGDSPLLTKLVGGTCALFAAYVLLRTIWRGGPAALRAVRSGQVWPWFALLAGVLVVVTKLIDGLGRKLSDVGLRISENVDQVSAMIEETGEAFIPVCAILAIVARWKGRYS